MDIDCSTISTKVTIEDNPKLYSYINFSLRWLIGVDIAGYYSHSNKKIYLICKKPIRHIEEITANILSHETLHKVISEFVGDKETHLIDIFLDKIKKRNSSKIDHSGIVLKRKKLFLFNYYFFNNLRGINYEKQ